MEKEKSLADVPNGTIIHTIKDASGAAIGDVEKVEGGFYIHRGKNRANLGRTLTENQMLYLVVWAVERTAPNYMDWKKAVRQMDKDGIK